MAIARKPPSGPSVPGVRPRGCLGPHRKRELLPAAPRSSGSPGGGGRVHCLQSSRVYKYFWIVWVIPCQEIIPIASMVAKDFVVRVGKWGSRAWIITRTRAEGMPLNVRGEWVGCAPGRRLARSSGAGLCPALRLRRRRDAGGFRGPCDCCLVFGWCIGVSLIFPPTRYLHLLCRDLLECFPS